MTLFCFRCGTIAETGNGFYRQHVPCPSCGQDMETESDDNISGFHPIDEEGEDADW